MKQKQLIIGMVVILILAGIGLGIYLRLNSPSEIPVSTEQEPTEVISPETEAPPTEAAEDRALQALTEYLAALNSGDYASAEKLYGGSYEMLEGYNPDVDPSDHALLLERACEFNGLNCLKLKSANLDQITVDNKFVFTIELQTNNGELFEIGPCCGEDEEGFIPVSVFTFTVIQVDPSHYKIMDLPPYTP